MISYIVMSQDQAIVIDWLTRKYDRKRTAESEDIAQGRVLFMKPCIPNSLVTSQEVLYLLLKAIRAIKQHNTVVRRCRFTKQLNAQTAGIEMTYKAEYLPTV